MDSATGRPRQSLVWVVLAVAALALALDLWSKAWALSALSGGEPRPLIGHFIQLQLIHNPGAAFSLGAGSTWIFTVLATVILVAILWYSTKVTEPLLAVLLGLLAGGAAGNLWDRLTRPPGFGRGHVVDFINYDDWFIGNVADIWIVLAAILMVVWRLTAPQSDAKGSA